MQIHCAMTEAEQIQSIERKMTTLMARNDVHTTEERKETNHDQSGSFCFFVFFQSILWELLPILEQMTTTVHCLFTRFGCSCSLSAERVEHTERMSLFFGRPSRRMGNTNRLFRLMIVNYTSSQCLTVVTKCRSEPNMSFSLWKPAHRNTSRRH